MPEFWIDADSLIVAHRGPYQFGMVQPFWDFVELKAREGIIGSPEIILDSELTSTSNKPDDLQLWAQQFNGILFLPVVDAAQVSFGRVADYVQNCGRYGQEWIVRFLDGGDPWLIAYAMAMGGTIVTFEKSEPRAKRPKIPDIAQEFGVSCMTLYEMLAKLKFRI